MSSQATLTGPVTKSLSRVIYYSHPMETYGTCLEDRMEVIVRKEFGDFYNISGWVTLLDAADDDGKRDFLDIDSEMARLGRGGRREAKRRAKALSRRVVTTLRRRFAVNYGSVLLNPAAFQQREFKRMTFPEFCRALIDHCDVVVGHGDILNGTIKKIILSNINARKSYAPDYHRQLRKLVMKTDMLWTAGSVDELRHAVSLGKQVLVLHGSELQPIDSRSLSQLESLVVPFYRPDDHNHSYRQVYFKVWRDPVRNAYKEWCAKTRDRIFVEAWTKG
jgi:hypothetical protein